MFKISLRQILGYKSKYIFLFIVITLGFTVISVMTAYTDSMRSSVLKAAEVHYGGELFIFGADKQSILIIDDIKAVENSIKNSGLDIEKIYKRTNLFNTGIIYYNGTGVRHKNIYGVDFDIEEDNFNNLDYFSGGVPVNKSEILISTVTARELKVAVGDSVTIKVNTRTGQVNTGQFVVSGIINDSGIFGAFRCFMDREELNMLLNVGINKYSSAGIYYSDDITPLEAADLLYKRAGADGLQLSDPIIVKEDLTYNINKGWKGIKYFILPLSVYVSQVSDLLLAMDLISYLLYLMIGSIIVISVYVSYNVILKDRTVEFASMRAIGTQRGHLKGIITAEALILLFISVIFGIFTSSVIFFIISKVEFTFITGFEIFLNNGQLLPLFKIERIVVNIFILLLSVIPSAYIPGRRVANNSIADGLIGR